MSLVLVEDRAAVRHVVLNRPEKRNALSSALVEELGAALRAAAGDPAIRVVVLRGEGTMFSSGMDTADLSALAAHPDRLHEWRASILEIWNLCEDMAKPTIAQIHGACLGGAAELVLACDMRVMAADAVIGLVETRIGLIPDVGGCSRLPALVGLGRAKELVLASKLSTARRPSGSGSSTASPRPTRWTRPPSSSPQSCWPAPRSPSASPRAC